MRMSSSSSGDDQAGLNTVLNRNIGALFDKRRADEANATLEERIAEGVTQENSRSANRSGPESAGRSRQLSEGCPMRSDERS